MGEKSPDSCNHKVIQIKETNKQIITEAIEKVNEFPIKVMGLYKESMPFCRKTFYRGVLELAEEGKISVEVKSFGRGMGVSGMLTSRN